MAHGSRVAALAATEHKNDGARAALPGATSGIVREALAKLGDGKRVSPMGYKLLEHASWLAHVEQCVDRYNAKVATQS